MFDVPGAFEMPLLAKKLAASERYASVAATTFIVDGGIYRHEFVAQTVVNGLMQTSLETGVPILSVSLTPHQYQETEHHNRIFQQHSVQKDRETARACADAGWLHVRKPKPHDGGIMFNPVLGQTKHWRNRVRRTQGDRSS